MRYALIEQPTGDVSTSVFSDDPLILSSPLNPQIQVPSAFVVSLIAVQFELQLEISSTVRLGLLTIVATVKAAGGVYDRLNVGSAQLQPAPPIPAPPITIDKWTGGTVLSLPVEMDPTDDYVLDVNFAGLQSGDTVDLLAKQSAVLLYGTADTDNT